MAFSTLACPEWTMPQIVDIASRCHYDGIELRFVEGEDSLYKLPLFSGSGMAQTKRMLSEAGLTICCVDTSCRFHSPDASERAKWIAEGERMANLAAELGAPGIRVFGDQIQAGAYRESTRAWIAESIRQLQQRSAGTGVEVWLETHGDFANAAETNSILQGSGSERVSVIWDPANCWIECGESPEQGAAGLRATIRHVHIKDLRQHGNKWEPVLNGEGSFPLFELRDALRKINFDAYISYEWEKKWHPQIASADIALPHFAEWFRKYWNA